MNTSGNSLFGNGDLRSELRAGGETPTPPARPVFRGFVPLCRWSEPVEVHLAGSEADHLSSSSRVVSSPSVARIPT